MTAPRGLPWHTQQMIRRNEGPAAMELMLATYILCFVDLFGHKFKSDWRLCAIHLTIPNEKHARKCEHLKHS